MRPPDHEVVQRLWRAELLDPLGHELGRLDVGRSVERDHPVERAHQPALGRATVIAGDVDDQRVVEDLETPERVDDTPDLIIGVLHVAGVDLHLPRQHRLEIIRHVLPPWDLLVPRGRLSIRRDHAELLLPGEDLLAQHVPPLVEAALVLIRPLGAHRVRRMRTAGREVHEELLVRHQRLLLMDPLDRVRRDVIVEVVALLRRLGRLDRSRALEQVRPVVVGLRADEPIKVLKPAAARRPRVKRSHLARLPRRHVVTLVDMRRRVAVQRQDLRQRRRRLRPDRGVPRRGRRRLGDHPHPHPHRMMVTARQQRLPRRRAQRADMEPVIRQPAHRQTVGVRRRARTAERVHRPEPRVVQQDQQHVRRALRRTQRLDRRELGVRIPSRHRSPAP